eukprot:6214540-Pleurochrysis_carterae.AAC.6
MRNRHRHACLPACMHKSARFSLPAACVRAPVLALDLNKNVDVREQIAEQSNEWTCECMPLLELIRSKGSGRAASTTVL